MQGVAQPLYGGMFRPYNAASTTAEAIRVSGVVTILYAIGVLACVFHLANGIWTFGITWGMWVTPAAQRWATVVCLVFGLGLGAVSMGALGGFAFVVDVQQARKVEEKMYEAKVSSEEIAPNEHKRSRKPTTPEAGKPAETAAVSAPLAPSH
jgi:succinate dehydrogenase / fumarate reductase cytochrome b subunit